MDANKQGDDIEIIFWGVNGSFPVPGKETTKYGGHTPCVSVHLPNDELIILDGGSGIMPLSSNLLKKQSDNIRANILITHEHWDHIHGLNFFIPFYRPNNVFNIYGPAQENYSFHDLLKIQMNGIFFPLKLEDLAADITYHSIRPDETFDVGSVKVSTIELQHPSLTLGYKLEYQNKVIAYITDNEIYDEDSEHYNDAFFKKLTTFIQDCDCLIKDCAYSEEKYQKRIHWGHSSPSQVIRLAMAANVKHLCLFHHDCDVNDNDIDDKLVMTQAELNKKKSTVICTAPVSGERILV